MSKYLYHNHHIIPKHMGGTDEPENLVGLTIEEHAEAHRVLYEEHGKQEDYIAWKMLCGQMKMPEMKRRLQLLGASKGGKKGGKIAGPKAKREKLGWHGMTAEQRKQNGLKSVDMKVGIHAEGYDKGIGGKKGGDKCRDEKIGFHVDGFDRGIGNRGKYWIRKDCMEQKCLPEELDGYLLDGWERGRKKGFGK